MAYLARMGLRANYAKTSLRSGIPRPCFSPNGQIAFVKDGQIRVVPTKASEAKASSNFTPADSLLKHTLIEKKNVRDVGDQMQRMNLGQAESEALDAGMQFAQKLPFNDNFFQKLLKMELPKVALCQTQGAGNAQKVQLN